MLQPVQLFKILSDETRLAIVMILRESGELCVCDICATISNRSPKSRDIWLSFARLGWFWIVVKANGSTIVCHPTYRHGQLRQSQHRQCMREDVREWLDKSACTSC